MMTQTTVLQLSQYYPTSINTLRECFKNHSTHSKSASTVDIHVSQHFSVVNITIYHLPPGYKACLFFAANDLLEILTLSPHLKIAPASTWSSLSCKSTAVCNHIIEIWHQKWLQVAPLLTACLQQRLTDRKRAFLSSTIQPP